MRYRSSLALLAGVAICAALMWAWSTPAAATDADEPICATWTWNSATKPYSEPMDPVKPDGASATTDTAVLVKPDVDLTNAGVEFATRDLDVTGPTTVTVTVTLDDGATAAAGAVRMFGYASATADTLKDKPDYVAPASGDGTLTLDVSGDLRVLGLVYDASNDTDGTVTFTGLKIGERPVSFVKCPEPEESPTGEPSPSVTAAPTTAAPTTRAPELALTPGGKPNKPLAIGGVLVVAGIAAIAGLSWWSRRRESRTEFRSE